MNLLTSIPSPSISYFALGPLKIHFYALCILAGIVAAVWIADKRLTAQGAKSGVALDIALWTVPIGIIGARIFHVLTHPADYFYPGADLSVVFRVWEGGIAIYGGLIGGALGALIGTRRAGISFSAFADAVAPGLLLAQALGRWGNYFNQELFGEPTNLPWGLEIDPNNPAIPAGTAPGTLFHPTFLYESVWSLLGVVALLALDKRFRLNNGRLFGLYLAIYSTGRLFTENLRLDPSEIILGLRTNIWSALFGVVIGLALFLVQTKRRSGVLDSSSNGLARR